MQSPRITVLMTVYNGTAYLAEAIDSVFAQLFDDFEFLIVDDCSTDGSVELIRTFDDPRLQLVLNEKNIGQAASLNRGLALAKGDYVARLDQDDVCMPKRLQLEAALLDKRPDVAIVCTWEYSIDEKGRRIRRWITEIDGFGGYLGMLLLGLCPVWHPSVMFKREIVQSLGGYDPSFAPAEDYNLWLRLAKARWTGAIVPEFLVLQRIHGERQSFSRREVQEKNTRRAHNDLVQQFCAPEHLEALGALLRMEDSFWLKNRSSGAIKKVLVTLSDSLERIDLDFQLSTSEEAAMRRVLYRRLGAGVKVGARVPKLPSILFYPLFWTMSPMCIPQLRRVATRINQRLPELRYPGRFLQSAAKRIIGAH